MSLKTTLSTWMKVSSSQLKMNRQMTRMRTTHSNSVTSTTRRLVRTKRSLSRSLAMTERSKGFTNQARKKSSSRMEWDERLTLTATWSFSLLMKILSRHSRMGGSYITFQRLRLRKLRIKMASKFSNSLISRLRSISQMGPRKLYSRMERSSAYLKMARRRASSLMALFKESKSRALRQ